MRRAVTLAAAVVAVVVVVVVVVLTHRPRPRRREPFDVLPWLKNVGATIAGAGKKVQNAIWKRPSANSSASSTTSNSFVPTYTGRRWDGYDWSCPDGTVETGAAEDAKACITSEWHNPVWKPAPGGGAWGWHCPTGTVPTNETQWEKKCLVGWTARQQDAGRWKCPSGTTDSGNDWNNSTWTEAQKQCRRSGPYTVRILKNNKWACPDGSKDTGKTWGAGLDVEWKQCKWTGP